MPDKEACCCGPLRYNLVFACSGASDVGEITDHAARRLSREKTAFMCCAAAIGAQVRDIVEKARAAANILVIDGCHYECAKGVLEQGGFRDFAYVQLETLGMEKGKCPATEARVDAVVAQAKPLLSC